MYGGIHLCARRGWSLLTLHSLRKPGRGATGRAATILMADNQVARPNNCLRDYIKDENRLLRTFKEWQAWHRKVYEGSRQRAAVIRSDTREAVLRWQTEENEETKVSLLHQAKLEYEKQYRQWPADDIRGQLPYENDDIHDLSLELTKYGELAQLTYDTMINRWRMGVFSLQMQGPTRSSSVTPCQKTSTPSLDL